jgi:hypothetical protein
MGKQLKSGVHNFDIYQAFYDSVLKGINSLIKKELLLTENKTYLPKDYDTKSIHLHKKNYGSSRRWNSSRKRI